MRVQTTSINAASVLRQRTPEHPLAVPPLPGTWGEWQVRRTREAPLGYVRTRSHLGRLVYDCYAHCRDGEGRRPWLRTTDTLDSAVAWMLQHEAEISALIGRSTPEPEVWPA